jgi:hypothetical protein
MFKINYLCRSFQTYFLSLLVLRLYAISGCLSARLESFACQACAATAICGSNRERKERKKERKKERGFEAFDAPKK